jgi:uncharacterized protein
MRSSLAMESATAPLLIDKVRPLAAYLQTLTTAQLQTAMNISAPLSHIVNDTLKAWNAESKQQSLAMDSFVGDIYSGLRASTLPENDRDYAQQTLRILSGLYGVLRPYDGVRPYRLEMGYKLPRQPFDNLYTYWGSAIAETLPKEGLIINLSAVEYAKTVMPYIDTARVVSPKFLTINPKTGEAGQVIVHTKIARGAFARWLMMSRITSLREMVQFNDLNYVYDTALSTSLEPTFACREFGGIGLSMRLQKI